MPECVEADPFQVGLLAGGLEHPSAKVPYVQVGPVACGEHEILLAGPLGLLLELAERVHELGV